MVSAPSVPRCHAAHDPRSTRPASILARLLGRVAEWQTRTVQVRVSVRTWGLTPPRPRCPRWPRSRSARAGGHPSCWPRGPSPREAPRCGGGRFAGGRFAWVRFAGRFALGSLSGRSRSKRSGLRAVCLGTRVMPDIVELIKSQHRQVDDLLKEPRRRPSRGEVRHPDGAGADLRAAAAALEAEDSFVYPTIAERTSLERAEVHDGTPSTTTSRAAAGADRRRPRDARVRRQAGRHGRRAAAPRRGGGAGAAPVTEREVHRRAAVRAGCPVVAVATGSADVRPDADAPPGAEDTTDVSAASKSELYELAKEQDVPAGEMTKDSWPRRSTRLSPIRCEARAHRVVGVVGLAMRRRRRPTLPLGARRRWRSGGRGGAAVGGVGALLAGGQRWPTGPRTRRRGCRRRRSRRRRSPRESTRSRRCGPPR